MGIRDGHRVALAQFAEVERIVVVKVESHNQEFVVVVLDDSAVAHEHVKRHNLS